MLGSVAPMATSGSPRLADRLGELRARYFVGRAAELDQFSAALTDGAVIVHVYGPGGIGKSHLLRAFARRAADSGARVVSLDGRDFDPSPDGFVRALGGADVESAVQNLGDDQRIVLFVDTYEVLAPLDGWLREELPSVSICPSTPTGTKLGQAIKRVTATLWRRELHAP